MASGSPSRRATCCWSWENEGGGCASWCVTATRSSAAASTMCFGFEGAEALVTPVRAPSANAYAERWVRTVRTECLDWLLIVGRGHLEQVFRVYVQHFNQHRPHRALGLEPPNPST